MGGDGGGLSRLIEECRKWALWEVRDSSCEVCVGKGLLCASFGAKSL